MGTNSMNRSNKIGKMRDFFESPECQHDNMEYQPQEPEFGVLCERYSCIDCGIELPVPEPDYDLINKSRRSR